MDEQEAGTEAGPSEEEKTEAIVRRLIDKKFYKMGEVVEFTELEPHVLRFWESEFDMLKPKKNGSGHRIYTKWDIDLILKIKKLVHDEGFTLAGARHKIATWLNGESEVPAEPMIAKVKIVKELVEIKGILKNLRAMLDEP